MVGAAIHGVVTATLDRTSTSRTPLIGRRPCGLRGDGALTDSRFRLGRSLVDPREQRHARCTGIGRRPESGLLSRCRISSRLRILPTCPDGHICRHTLGRRRYPESFSCDKCRGPRRRVALGHAPGARARPLIAQHGRRSAALCRSPRPCRVSVLDLRPHRCAGGGLWFSERVDRPRRDLALARALSITSGGSSAPRQRWPFSRCSPKRSPLSFPYVFSSWLVAGGRLRRHGRDWESCCRQSFCS